MIHVPQLSISTAKFKDLSSICDSGIIPNEYHSFYHSLHHISASSRKSQNTNDQNLLLFLEEKEENF